jgi:hypothetical protein
VARQAARVPVVRPGAEGVRVVPFTVVTLRMPVHIPP